MLVHSRGDPAPFGRLGKTKGDVWAFGFGGSLQGLFFRMETPLDSVSKGLLATDALCCHLAEPGSMHYKPWATKHHRKGCPWKDLGSTPVPSDWFRCTI